MFLTLWSVRVLKQHQALSRAALRSQHSRPCSLCQLKSYQKPQGNIRRQILPVKGTEKGSSKAWCAFSQQTLTARVSGEGSGLWGPGARSAAGAARPSWGERLHRGTPALQGERPRAAASSHPTWTQILAFPAALPTSAIYAAGTVPISKAKTSRGYNFVPLFMVVLANLEPTGLGLWETIYPDSLVGMCWINPALS